MRATQLEAIQIRERSAELRSATRIEGPLAGTGLTRFALVGRIAAFDPATRRMTIGVEQVILAAEVPLDGWPWA